MRRSGILLHISSLPGPYGIGTFGPHARQFVDRLNAAGQTWWQILPLGPTSYGDSPYQTFSAFALNPYFIDPDILVGEGLLTKAEARGAMHSGHAVDYGWLHENRLKTLEKAFGRFDPDDPAFHTFLHENGTWLDDYALFMAIKEDMGGVSWAEWDDHLRMRKKDALDEAGNRLGKRVMFHRFLQYKAYTQWMELKTYANLRGVKIIGDMPIYVSYDSSDVWAEPHLFDLDDERRPRHIAGVPPDSYSDDGQLWGNPLYDWDVMKENGYKWWTRRVESSMVLFDRIRIDHFIGFQNFFLVTYGEKTAQNGIWKKGPGIALFDAIKESLGDVDIIAEDLGVVTPDVRALLEKTGFPGMKLLQFAFDARESSDYLPHRYTRNTVVYTGTHDNMTTKTWLESLKDADLIYCLDYINHGGRRDPVDSMIKATLLSVSDTAVIPMQDYLHLGSEGRMNTPSTLGNNWTWRMKPSDFSKKLVRKMAHFTALYGREPKELGDA
jgi:4-alpha-glucanotransferase